MIHSGLDLEYAAFPMPPSYIKKACNPPPPSRAGMDSRRRPSSSNDDGLQDMLQSVSCKLKQVFDKQTESERRAARAHNTGRRRATVSQEERLKKTLPLLPHEHRSVSLDLQTAPDKQIPRKPVPLRPKRSPSGRPIGLRRPLLKLNDAVTDLSNHASSGQSKPSGRTPDESTSPEGTSTRLRLPPAPPPFSPPISPTAASFDSLSPSCTSTDESEITITGYARYDQLSDQTVKVSSSDIALEGFWNWDDSACSLDTESQLHPSPSFFQPTNPRKPSLKMMLRRPKTSCGTNSANRQSLEHHGEETLASPTDNEPRSEMVWDSSDDEDSFGKKLRVSFSKNSLKRSKIANILRRNSGE